MRVSKNEDLIIPANRTFGLVTCSFFIIIVFTHQLSGVGRIWALCLAFLFGIISIVKPSVLSPLNILWTRFGLLLHRISSPVILTVLFFAIITPFGMIMRVFRKDALHLKFNPDADSYWIILNPKDDSQSMINQF